VSGDELIRTLSPDGFASVRVLAATGLVREAARRHQTSPTATVALATWLIYVFAYTPLKTRSPLNTAVGAVSGALPILRRSGEDWPA